MIYVLYGADKYRLSKRLNEIKKTAGIQEGDPNLVEFNTDFDFGKIVSEASVMPFLAEKRVLVISGFLSTKDKVLFEKIVSWLPECPAETEVIFVEDETPDQRLGITKALTKMARVEAFSVLTPAETIQNIEKMVKDRGANIDRDAASLLQLYAGTDLVRISNEVDKLVSYDPHITKDKVDLLVDAGYFNTIFELTDALSSKNQRKALGLLEKALDSGENESYLLSMMSMQVRNLMLVLDLHNHRLSEPEIVSRTKLHPYVVKKTLSMVRNFDVETLIETHREILTIEEALKTTSYDPRSLLVSFIIKITSN